MSSLSNAERQKRFRELTMRERNLKAAAFDRLTAFIDAQSVTDDRFPLPDGRELKLTRLGGEALVQIIPNASMQEAIKGGRLRMLYGEADG
jgi:hypothetical protein